MNKKNSRRQYFIDKDFQLNFILKFCLVVVISAMIVAILIFMFSQGSTTVAIENTKVQVKQTSDFILPIVVRIILIVTFFSACAVAFISLLFSHKISGPLFRIKREVELLTEGDLKRNFTIRSADQLQELSKSLTSMTNMLKKHHKELRAKVTNLKNYLENKDYVLQPYDKEEISALLNQITAELDTLKS